MFLIKPFNKTLFNSFTIKQLLFYGNPETQILVCYNFNMDNEPYLNFASIYDQIMSGVDYEAWADYVEDLLNHFGKQPKSIVDLACGTGASTFPFSKRDYKVTGVDISSQMLKRASLAASEQTLKIKFYQQDLRQLNLPEKYDLALLFQDGLNYIVDEKDLAQTFLNVNNILNPGALFIFDLTRPSLRPTHNSSTAWADEESFTLIWDSSYEAESGIWSIKLTVFQKLDNELYKKYQESHCEKDHDPEQVQKLIAAAGFKLIGIYKSFSFSTSDGNDVKLTFVVQK